MKIEDTFCRARGFVKPSWIDIPTGRVVPFDRRHNTLSYMSAEAMAAAFGGDPSYIPSRIGFIYGDSATLTTESVISRHQTWDELLSEISSSGYGSNADIQVVGFSYSPTLGGDIYDPGESSSSSSSSSSDSDDTGDYTNILSTGSNVVTFHAVSNSQDLGKAASTSFIKDKYIYQAVLLGYHNSQYYVLSRVSLEESTGYLQKPDGFEIALDWEIVFK